ncbi:unnamed protein product [Paramecium primaurelia]|uniref:Transmembrane protein n=1 Tax=Paramecium primaurelia TaxID=5886 RepID=A0A8S1K9Q7_PARPR|nr:unnamed protein product [Paramecium primaurelia]
MQFLEVQKQRRNYKFIYVITHRMLFLKQKFIIQSFYHGKSIQQVWNIIFQYILNQILIIGFLQENLKIIGIFLNKYEVMFSCQQRILYKLLRGKLNKRLSVNNLIVKLILISEIYFHLWIKEKYSMFIQNC